MLFSNFLTTNDAFERRENLKNTYKRPIEILRTLLSSTSCARTISKIDHMVCYTIDLTERKTHNINALIHKFLFYCKKQKKSKIIKFQILNFHQSNARR